MYSKSMSRAFLVTAALLAVLALAGLGIAQPALAATTQADAATGYVAVDALNLRVGPGFRYAVLRLLPAEQALTLLGQSRDGVWVEVRVPNGPGGWVYAAFVRTSADLAKLPVSEAAGGPNDVPAANPGYAVFVTITDNVATVDLQRYPANTEIVLRLSRSDGSGALEVARGTTSGQGTAQIRFEMPRLWADGSALTETALKLTAASADGKFSRSASLQYYR